MSTAFQQQLVAARTMLAQSLPALELELAVFNRLLYRNRNQHRRGVYFRRALHVRRRFAATAPAIEALRVALQLPVRAHDELEMSTPLAPIPSRSVDVGTALPVLLCAGAALFGACSASLACARHFLHLLASGYFLPLALSTIAALARLVALARLCMDALAPLLAERSGAPSLLSGAAAQAACAAVRAAAWLHQPRYLAI